MAAEAWATIRLGAACVKIGSGATPRGGSEVYLKSGPFALIRSQNIHNDAFRRDGLAFIGETHAAELSNVEVLREDVLLNITGDSVGRVCQVDPGVLPARVNQHVAILRTDPAKLDSRFLRHALVSPEAQSRLLAWAGAGATRDALTKGMIESFELLAPIDVAEQRAIARILGALEDKIELIRRMSETLESMARSLFKSWFVDFDPVRAKCQHRETALPEEVARLFPDALESTEHGEIPKGWSYRPLGELVDLTRGRTYKGNLKGLPGPVLLGLASIRRNGGFRDDNLSTYGGESPEDLLVYPGELFASLKDVTQAADLLGAVARVPGHVKAGRLTQDTVKLGLKSGKTSRSILYRCLLTDAYRAYCRAHATGTTNLGLSRDDFLAFPIPQPPESVARLYDSINLSLDSRIALLTEESRTLAAMRDLLLPKLISGELRVDPVRTHQHLPSPA